MLPAALIYLPSYVSASHLYECLGSLPFTTAAYSQAIVPTFVTGFWIVGMSYWAVQRSRLKLTERQKQQEREKMTTYSDVSRQR